MLMELLPLDHIRHEERAGGWEEAIRIASVPLLEEGVIEESYVDRMIASVKTHGPYIILADYFALPHAAPGEGVNKLGMALLVLDEAVDLIGNPVKLFLVLAAVDNTSHLEALAEVSELLMEKEHFDVFLTGDVHRIREIIEKGGERG